MSARLFTSWLVKIVPMSWMELRFKGFSPQRVLTEVHTMKTSMNASILSPIYPMEDTQPSLHLIASVDMKSSSNEIYELEDGEILDSSAAKVSSFLEESPGSRTGQLSDLSAEIDLDIPHIFSDLPETPEGEWPQSKMAVFQRLLTRAILWKKR